MKKICGLSIDFVIFLGVLLFLGLLVGIVAIPNYVNGGPAPLNKVINNLRIIEGAKEQWALENKKEKGALPTLSELAPYLKDGQLPKPAVKEKYEINPVGVLATAKTPVRLSTYPAGSVITAQ